MRLVQMSIQIIQRKLQIKEWFESQVVRANYELKFGEDWWWKLNEVHDAMLEKIGASDVVMIVTMN